MRHDMEGNRRYYCILIGFASVNGSLNESGTRRGADKGIHSVHVHACDITEALQPYEVMPGSFWVRYCRWESIHERSESGRPRWPSK